MVNYNPMMSVLQNLDSMGFEAVKVGILKRNIYKDDTLYFSGTPFEILMWLKAGAPEATSNNDPLFIPPKQPR